MKKWLAKNLFKMASGLLKNTKHEGNAKSVIMTILAIIVVFIIFFIATVLAIFHYFFCAITFGFGPSCERDEKGEVAITEEELDDLAERMIKARIHVNEDGDIDPGYEGEEYGSDGKLPSQNYQQFCGPYSGQFSDLINKYGEEHGVDPQLIAAIIKQESNFNPNATSHAGAGGLMQLMPETARGLGIADRFDPEQNIKGGSKYIRQMLDGQGGNLELALAAYNWGPGNLGNAKAAYGSDWASIKSFAPKETQNYVTKVMNNYNDFGKDSGSCSSASGGSKITWQNGTSEKITAEHIESLFKGTLVGGGKHVVKYAKEYSIDPVFAAAILMHESGKGSNYKGGPGYYNFGGIKCASKEKRDKFGFTCKNGTGNPPTSWSSFSSQEKGIQYNIYLISEYVAGGLDTVGAVQAKYCPIDDGDCDKWQPLVNSYMDEIYKTSGVQRSYAGIAQPTQDEVVADASVGVFPLPKGGYQEFSDSWGAERQGGDRTHEGTDIMSPKGTPIYSATDGTITKKGWNQYGGWTYSIRVGDVSMYYAHLSKYVGDGDGKQALKQGDNVKRGQLLGYVGHTGSQDGADEGYVNPNMLPHLHFGIYRNGTAINPYPTLKKWEGNYGGVSGQTIVDTIAEIIKENGGKGAKTDFCYGYDEKGPVITNPCRDFAQTVFKKVDIDIGANPAKQFASSKGKDVPLNDAGDDFAEEDNSLKPGDVLFFGEKDVKKEGMSAKEMVKKYPNYYAEKDGKVYSLKWTAIYIGTENMKRKVVRVDDKGKVYEDYVDTDWEKSQLIGAKRFTSAFDDEGRANSGLNLQVDGYLTAEDEAKIHIRSLMQTDMYALAGTGLKESEVKDLQGKIDQQPEIDEIVEEKYKDTYIDKTWQMVKKHRERLMDGGKEMGVDDEDVVKWTLEEEFMNLRLTAYSCYLAWDDTGFFVGESDQPCDYINTLYKEATGETDDYIPFEKQGVLMHIQETTYSEDFCDPVEDSSAPEAVENGTNNAEAVIESLAITKEAETEETLWGWVTKLKEAVFGKNFPVTPVLIEKKQDCGPGTVKRTETSSVREVKYKMLIEDVLMNFGEFSLLEPGVSTDEDEPYDKWIIFYLQEAYKAQGGNLIVGGGGGTVGGNIAIPSSGIFTSPIPADAANGQWTVTSEYGPRWGKTHAGIDIAFYHGAPGVESDGSGPTIYSIGAGKVTYADWMDGYGNVVFIQHENGYASVYGHMKQKPSVKVGQTVEAGAPLGIVGNTGNSTGPHLHLTICKDGSSCRQKINPRLVVKLPGLNQAASSFKGW